MDDSDHNAGTSEVSCPQELPENHVKTSSESTNKSCTFKLDCKQNDNVAMDTIEDTIRPEKRNVIEIVETLVRNKQAHFKSQQRGDPDLSVDEKRAIAENLFDKSPSGFLLRFGHLLSKNHLDYFLSFKYASDQEREDVSYQLSYLGASSSKSSKTRLKNRRYDALQKMIHSGSYFSMEEMQARNPLLFEQLVGKYQTDEERQTEIDDIPTNAGFAWMEHFTKQVEKERMEKLKEQQKLDEAGDDYSSDETDEQVKKTDDASQLSLSLWGEYQGKFEADNSKKKKVPKNKENERHLQNASEEEKVFYLQEFQTAMYHSFLSGNDKDFDYTTVDNNSEYDSVDMRERDEQDQYFDDESPDSKSQADMDITEGSQDDLSQFCEEPPVITDSASKVTMDEDVDNQGDVCDRLTEFCKEPPVNSDSASKVTMDEDVDDQGDVCDRLTEDDVQNLKTFASSWAKSHSHSESKSVHPERTIKATSSGEMDVTERSSPVTHRVPIKKNHKIKISLKTKEM